MWSYFWDWTLHLAVMALSTGNLGGLIYLILWIQVVENQISPNSHISYPEFCIFTWSPGG